MSRFRLIFRNRHVILPVVHVESEAQAIRNSRIARDAGSDGVFLIDHSMSYKNLLEIHRRVVEAVPGWWVGVNCLDLEPEQALQKMAADIAGLWVDDAYVDERESNQTRARSIQAARYGSGWEGLYFGGVAFKYRRAVADLERAARVASGLMDVVTTSGPGTGQAADRKKIAEMRRGLVDSPLAIASGITPSNVIEYLDLADCFLVATGVSKSFTELDPGLLESLVVTVRSFER